MYVLFFILENAEKMSDDKKPSLGRFEQEFLTAVIKGEVSAVNDLLEKRDELDLNINCRDASGKSALRIAITEGNLGKMTSLNHL